MSKEVEKVPEFKENKGPQENKVAEAILGKSNHQQENLLTKVISFGGRSYYLDVRENKWGRYLKLTESSAKRRSTILLSGNVVSTLVQTLDDIIKGNYKPREMPEKEDKWQTIYSRSATSFRKKIYMDLMENKYGRSLNIAEISESRPKTSVIITEQGWLQLQRALTEIVEGFPEFAPRPAAEKGTLMASKKLSVGSKVLFFDLMENQMGAALKLSEIRKGKREKIFIPDVALHPIKILLSNLAKDDFESEVSGLEKVLKDGPENEATESDVKILTKRSLKLETDDPEDTKLFFLELRENSFGKFLKISELKQNRKRAVFIPSESFKECHDILGEIEGMLVDNSEQ